jgi:hypothetical protein
VPTCIPISVIPTIVASQSDLIDCRWSKEKLDADFAIPGDRRNLLRVHFDKTMIIRSWTKCR